MTSQAEPVRRRSFLTLLGGEAAAWPLAARAQQPAMPVIGWLDSMPLEGRRDMLVPFRQGLSESGYVVGQNVAFEYRSAQGQYERLPALASEFVARRVAVIVAVTANAAVVAKAVTAVTPIVFLVGPDPVKLGLVQSFNRPGGNMTGVSFFSNELAAKRLGLLHDLVPQATVIAVLVNPNNLNAGSETSDAQKAARVLGLQIQVLRAGSATATWKRPSRPLPRYEPARSWSPATRFSPAGLINSLSWRRGMRFPLCIPRVLPALAG